LKQTVRTSEKATTCCSSISKTNGNNSVFICERVRQCEDLTEYAMSEQIREILIDEQDHQIALATALGKSVPPQRKAA